MWNSLPDYVILANNVNQFKNRLDKAVRLLAGHNRLWIHVANVTAWLLRLNIDKCKSASYYLKHPIDTQYHIMDNNNIGNGCVQARLYAYSTGTPAL